jgi:hypothetical protein
MVDPINLTALNDREGVAEIRYEARERVAREIRYLEPECGGGYDASRLRELSDALLVVLPRNKLNGNYRVPPCDGKGNRVRVIFWETEIGKSEVVSVPIRDRLPNFDVPDDEAEFLRCIEVFVELTLGPDRPTRSCLSRKAGNAAG